MRPDNAGRCTDRKAYQGKTVAYILNQLDANADALVRKGEPLSPGKVVVGKSSCFTLQGDAKQQVDTIINAIENRGIELVNLEEVFAGRCWYDSEDERTTQKLLNGEIYTVIKVLQYNSPCYKVEYWNARKASPLNDDIPTETGRPIAVDKLITDYKRLQIESETKKSVQCAKMLAESEMPAGVLDTTEKVLVLTFMSLNCPAIGKSIGLSAIDATRGQAIKKYVAEHPEYWTRIERMYIAQQMSASNSHLYVAEQYLDELGVKWSPEGYKEAKEKISDKYSKSADKLCKQLADLGYDIEGNKLTSTDPTPHSLADYARLKAENKDAILLFRDGDFYDLYKEDAEVASKVLGLTLTTTRYNGEDVKTCGFTARALNDYLPKLIKLGKRVAMCKTLKNR